LASADRLPAGFSLNAATFSGSANLSAEADSGLVFIWFVALGLAITQLGLASLVDRADRRDLSFFRRGFDWLDLVLELNDALPPGFSPSFEKVLCG
jgi:hypothetical protein